jgi:hypothetical protein
MIDTLPPPQCGHNPAYNKTAHEDEDLNPWRHHSIPYGPNNLMARFADGFEGDVSEKQWPHGASCDRDLDINQVDAPKAVRSTNVIPTASIAQQRSALAVRTVAAGCDTAKLGKAGRATT